MVEIDTSAHRVTKFWKNHAKASVPFLLTQERTQVLDILVHLITNSSESILFCGPEGVGKTQLLEVLQIQEIPSCTFCRITGYKELGLDKIQGQLDKAFRQVRSGKNDRTFANVYADKEVLPTKTVLIIENAGVLAPGVSTAVLQFADKTPNLSVIFVLTHDELQLKYRTDQAVEDCHIVELPPLTEKQCGEFVQHLLALASGGVNMNALSDSRVSELYQLSHGLPARIINEYSSIPQKTEENPTKILIMAVAGLIAVALAVQWFSSRQTLTESKIPAGEPVKSADLDIDQPFLSLPIPETENRFQTAYLQLDEAERLPRWSDRHPKMAISGTVQNTETLPDPAIPQNDDRGPNQHTNNSSNLENTESSEDTMQPAEGPFPKTTGAAGEPEVEASDWLLAQPENNFTLQIMVLSKQRSIFDVIRKYPSLRKDMKYIRRLIKNKERFVLLYGSFANAVLAEKARQKLPAEFRKSMTRKMSAIREELK